MEDLSNVTQVPESSGVAVTHLVFLLSREKERGKQERAGQRAAGYDLKRAEMTGDVEFEFKSALLARFKELQDLTPVDFTAFSERQPHEVEVVKIEKVPVLCEILASIDRQGGPQGLEQVAGIDSRLLSHLSAYAVITEWPDRPQDRVLYFRKFLRSRVIRAGGPFKFLFQEGRLQKVTDYVFNFDEHADALVFGGSAFVFQRTLFEEIFDYARTVYQPAADKAIGHLKEARILSDIPGLEEACAQDPNKLRKLADIGQNIDPKKLTWGAIDRIQKKWGVPVDLDFTKECIVFSRATAWNILKLLDDDFLRSDMTKNLYEVQSKRRMKPPGRLRVPPKTGKAEEVRV